MELLKNVICIFIFIDFFFLDKYHKINKNDIEYQDAFHCFKNNVWSLIPGRTDPTLSYFLYFLGFCPTFWVFVLVILLFWDFSYFFSYFLAFFLLLGFNFQDHSNFQHFSYIYIYILLSRARPGSRPGFGVFVPVLAGLLF